MSRMLAATLGWIAPSERFSNTVERAQVLAYNEGAQETTAEHLFAAELEDLDAVYFLAQFGIPLTSAAEAAIKIEPPKPAVPRIAPPSYSPTKVLQEPHRDIPASAGLRRVIALASAIAERSNVAELHGGIVLEALLEDGRSQSAARLQAVYAEAVRGRRTTGPALPGASHKGAVIAVLSPDAAAPKAAPPPPPRKTLDDPLAQVRWLQSEVARELSQDRTFKFIRELDAFADKARAYISSSAYDLRMQAYAELSSNPIYRVHQELQEVEQAAEALHNRVRQTALNVQDGQPTIFSRFMSVIPAEAAQALQSLAAARAEEKANLAAMRARAEADARAYTWNPAQEQDSSYVYNAGTTRLGHPSTYAPEGNVGFLKPMSNDWGGQDDPDELNLEKGDTVLALSQARQPKKRSFRLPIHFGERVAGRLSKVWMVVAAAGAGMVSLSFLL